MDDLDKQLAELQLLADKEKLQQHGTLGKKIGPAVPPKPKKATQPLVPQSYSINQQLEPSYSSRLNTTAQYYANIGSTSPLVTNQQQYANLPNNTNNTVNSVPTNHYANLHMEQPQKAIHISHAQPQQARLGGLLNSVPKPYSSTITSASVVNNATYINVMDDRVIYSNLAHMPSGGSGVGVVGGNGGGGVTRGGVIYSNVGMVGVGDANTEARRYSETDDLPPPPPPIDHVTGGGGVSGGVSTSSVGASNSLADYAPCTVNTNLPPPPDDFPPPPSPVSSSYSELRRATEPIGQEYSNYGLGSQSSSTYESIYEPINPPRPPSQLSSRSNYSLYTPYGGSSSAQTGGPSPSASRMDHHHGSGGSKVGDSADHTTRMHHDVDHMSDMMLGQQQVQGQGRQVQQQVARVEEEGVDVYGLCVKCGEKVVGENSGCTAMEQIYHTKCFTCHHCAINLQGKPFYSLDGNPYCKEDYLNTLEKCCVCMNPILDRILRATGKPYHPKCFTCVICGKSLDGIPFTVDATNQIHCIDDFHKKFAPRCCVCNLPIMPEPGQEETVRVVALDRSFHIQCYKCEDCGLVLSSEAEGRGCYPLDNHVLCKSCNAKRVQTLTSHMTTDL